MELRSVLRVGIRRVMTTTIKILKQKKGANAIWNHINVQPVVILIRIQLDISMVNHIVAGVSLLKAKKSIKILVFQKQQRPIYLMSSRMNKRFFLGNWLKTIKAKLTHSCRRYVVRERRKYA